MASEVPLSPRARGHAPSPASGTFPPAVCLKLMGSLDSLQLSPGCTCASERLLRAGEEREQRGLFPMTVAVVVFFGGVGEGSLSSFTTWTASLVGSVPPNRC